MEQLHTITSKAEYHPHIYEKLRDIEAQIRTGKVQNIPAYVVKVLQNEFGVVGSNDKAYEMSGKVRDKMAEKVRKHFQKDQNAKREPAEERITINGSSIGEHIAKIANLQKDE